VRKTCSRGRQSPGDEAGAMLIFIETLDGEVIKLDVEPTNTIAYVKLKIHDKAGFPVEQQQVLLRYQELKDDRSLSEYNIRDKSTLLLMLPGTDGVRGPVPQEDVGGDRMEIFIITSTGKVIKLHVNPTDTVADLKQLIQEEKGIPTALQSLSYKYLPLKDGLTLREQRVESKASMYLTLRSLQTAGPRGRILPVDEAPMKIKVRTLTGSMIEVEVEQGYTVAKVKELIETKEGTSGHLQHLLHAGKLLDDRRTLRDDSIGHGSILDLIPRLVLQDHLLSNHCRPLEPANDASDVPVDTKVSCTVDDSVEGLTPAIARDFIRLHQGTGDGPLVPGVSDVDIDTRTITFEPDSLLRPGTRYRITISQRGLKVSEVLNISCRERRSYCPFPPMLR
jgi:hypothetical protein